MGVSLSLPRKLDPPISNHEDFLKKVHSRNLQNRPKIKSKFSDLQLWLKPGLFVLTHPVDCHSDPMNLFFPSGRFDDRKKEITRHIQKTRQ